MCSKRKNFSVENSNPYMLHLLNLKFKSKFYIYGIYLITIVYTLTIHTRFTQYLLITSGTLKPILCSVLCIWKSQNFVVTIRVKCILEKYFFCTNSFIRFYLVCWINMEFLVEYIGTLIIYIKFLLGKPPDELE